jgi:hypothetical protein
VLVLLPVSACRVVVTGGIVPVGVVEVEGPPQEARTPERHSDPNAIKQRGTALVFTETTPMKVRPQSGYSFEWQKDAGVGCDILSQHRSGGMGEVYRCD